MYDKSASKRIGKFGEEAASEYLAERGYEIVSRNYKSRYGEIDIIALYEGYIVFVEVKTRNDHSIARPYMWVDRNKQRRIISAAGAFLKEHKYYRLKQRFDIIEVVHYGKKEIEPDINHIKSAFQIKRGYNYFY